MKKPRIDHVPEMDEAVRHEPDEWACVMCGAAGKGGLDAITAHVAVCPVIVAFNQRIQQACPCPRCAARRAAEGRYRRMRWALLATVFACAAVVWYVAAVR